MRTVVLMFLVLGSGLAQANQKLSSETVAGIFGLGVYAQMDRETLENDPKATITHDVDQTRGEPGVDVFKVFRETSEGRCGAVVYVENGKPTLQSSIDCDGGRGVEKAVSFDVDRSVYDLLPGNEKERERPEVPNSKKLYIKIGTDLFCQRMTMESGPDHIWCTTYVNSAGKLYMKK